MTDEELWEAKKQSKAAFGPRCTKLSGAFTVELIKKGIEEKGIRISPRDVFIRGVPIELDLLIPKPTTTPQYNLIYEPDDVLAVFEIKSIGPFGKHALESVRANFSRVREANHRIWCAYVTLRELEKYKWAASEADLGYPVFTLFRYTGSGRNERVTSTGDWNRLLNEVTRRDSLARRR